MRIGREIVSNPLEKKPLQLDRNPSPPKALPNPETPSGQSIQTAQDSFGSKTRIPTDVKSTFRQEFGALAESKEKFHSTMRSIFGESYDVAKAEQFRQRAKAGDYSWLPKVELVDPNTLGGANGAYDSESGKVLINRDLDPKTAASAFVEEAGHHLDAQLNKKDTPGEEGEMFRRVLSGEKLSAAQIAEIRSKEGTGKAIVDGKIKDVEFWNPFKAVGQALSSAGKAIGGAVTSAGKAIGGALSTAGKTVAGVAKEAGRRIGDGVTGLATGLLSAVVGGAKNIGEGIGTFFGGIGKIFQGKFAEGLKQMGLGLLKTFVQTPVDAFLMIGGRTISAIQTLLGIERVGRKLTNDEISTLKSVYGDSIDYSKIKIKEGNAGLLTLGKRPFTHGDTIYVPKGSLPLTKETLVHESAHVWQNQHGGTDYMSEALWAQAFGDAYKWKKGVDEGKSWRQLDPEQQAELISHAYADGYFTGNRITEGGKDYTDYINNAVKEMRAGRGAP